MDLSKVKKAVEPEVSVNDISRISARTIIKGEISSDNDIRVDGKVNGKDLTRLMKRLADENTEAVSAALDVNGDGSINAIDINILMRYIAGADVTVY